MTALYYSDIYMCGSLPLHTHTHIYIYIHEKQIGYWVSEKGKWMKWLYN